MDVNRRYLIGATAAGAATALAMSPEPARAAPSPPARPRRHAIWRAAWQPDDQTKNLQRAIDEAARAQMPLALPPGVYRNRHVAPARTARN